MSCNIPFHNIMVDYSPTSIADDLLSSTVAKGWHREASPYNTMRFEFAFRQCHGTAVLLNGREALMMTSLLQLGLRGVSGAS